MCICLGYGLFAVAFAIVIHVESYCSSYFGVQLNFSRVRAEHFHFFDDGDVLALYLDARNLGDGLGDLYVGNRTEDFAAGACFRCDFQRRVGQASSDFFGFVEQASGLLLLFFDFLAQHIEVALTGFESLALWYQVVAGVAGFYLNDSVGCAEFIDVGEEYDFHDEMAEKEWDKEGGLLLEQVCYERQEAEMASAFDGCSHFALEFHRVARDAAGQEFALLVDEVHQKVYIFVVDVFDTKTAEAAVFFAFLTEFGIVEKLNVFSCCHDMRRGEEMKEKGNGSEKILAPKLSVSFFFFGFGFLFAD